jgi:formylglycine-generating enzyme required for sulfatase activity
MSEINSMNFGSLGDIDPNNLSDDERIFCIRLGKEMVRVPAGDFMMGALEDDEDAYNQEKPHHKVTLTRDFFMGRYSVTQALWESVMGSNPSESKGANRPVEQVSWFDCVTFCNKLSEQEGLKPAYEINGENVTCDWTANGYRLPTEAEWEYSARGGEYHKYAGSDNVDEVAWYDGNSGYETHIVGQKKLNGFGLYDMSGNVWDWVWDLYGQYSSESQQDSVENPTGDLTGSLRVYRGGSWRDSLRDVRTSNRNYNNPTYRRSRIGLRLCRFT